MNIQRLPEHIIRWLVILGGMALGFYSVRLAGFAQFGRLALIYSIIAYFALALVVGPRIWVAIPVAWGLSGQIPALDLPFTLRDLVVMLVFTTCLIFKAFKMFNRSTKYDWVDVTMILLVLYVGSCFIRNPVGVDALGSDRVGGRPYFNVFIGCLAFWTLSRCSLRARSANKLVIAMTAGRMFEGAASQFLKWFPSLSIFLASYYTCGFFEWAVEPDSVVPIPGAESTGRLGYLMAVGYPLALCLCSFCRPIGLLNPIRIWRFILLIVAIVCVLLSGFRSAIAAVIGFFAVSAYVWRGKGELWKMGIAGGLALALLVLGQGTFFELPRSAQRALSFLPGRWDPYSRHEAEASTKWRTDMWVEMLTTDRYIENKLLGDGFGFTKRDLELMVYFKKAGDVESGQQNFMISGQVHSGPVSSVKYVGYVGLVMILTLLVGMAITAWRVIKRAKNTPFMILALFVCIPPVIEPLYFTLIFGGFENAIVDALVTLGLLRMLRNSLDDLQTPLTAAQAVPSLAAAHAEPRARHTLPRSI